jgi:hypothetical protein
LLIPVVKQSNCDFPETKLLLDVKNLRSGSILQKQFKDLLEEGKIGAGAAADE